MRMSEHPRAIWILAMVAFIESSFFPVPVDVMLIPMVLAARHRAWLYAFVAMTFSVLGGLFGYAIGMFAYEQIAEPALLALGKADAMAEYATRFNDMGFWTVLMAGITPFPFKVITIMSGATAMPLWLFVSTAIIARSVRFFLVCGLLYFFGPPIKSFIERYLGWVFAAGLAVLFLGFLGVQYL
jgi:membrane protein YqaA with SNARE-associated domain